jgi:hypothetical protein
MVIFGEGQSSTSNIEVFFEKTLDNSNEKTMGFVKIIIFVGFPARI